MEVSGMKLYKTEDAVGQILCHDITQIIPGVVKDAVFRKGHVIREEDIPVLLSVGKEHIYVWENNETMLHENDAAEISVSYTHLHIPDSFGISTDPGTESLLYDVWICKSGSGYGDK